MYIYEYTHHLTGSCGAMSTLSPSLQSEDQQLQGDCNRHIMHGM